MADRRYELIEKIGTGDFATTFSARDLKLDRRVAIKKLHEQFQGDNEKLARYWDEAQLLASLEHPNNMTIYDVVRSQSCLVLELMQGSLRQIYKDKPMPVDDVRQTLIQALKGLKCLHDNGIVHGDITPSNLFLSRQDVVKLGDFGLARRVSDDDGSLIKGTTRYIAPEIVSEEFGQVGPASDLYSIGFSALDLLVGPQFESLFPDLIAFGRDRKMAWMMWHCSADRKFPPIQSILEGVPEDLAKVLNKLTTKDQNERYTSAQEALDDLSSSPVTVGQSLKDEAAAAAELARLQKKKRRRTAFTACFFSLCLCGAILYFNRDIPEPPERTVPPPIRGVVQNVLPFEQKLVLDLGQDWKEVSLRAGDQVILNRLERQLRDLEIGDRVVVHTRLDPNDKSHYELMAFRPATHTGVIESVDAESGQISFKVTEGVEAENQFDLLVPPETPITLNTMSRTIDEVPFTVKELSVGDRVTIENSDDEDGMLALSIEAYRDSELKGFIREIDASGNLITLALSATEKDADLYVSMPLHTECTFSLNGLPSLNQRAIQLADLQPGDRVTLRHDSKATAIAAWRVYDVAGKIAKINFDGLRLTDANGKSFAVGPETEITLGDQTVSFTDLRQGDVMEVSHDSPGDAIPVLDRLTATRPANRKKWAILIANDSFADAAIGKLEHASANASLLRQVLTSRYAVPASQAIAFTNVDRVRLQREVPDWVSKVPRDAELYVYVSTRAFSQSPENQVYLAASDSNRQQLEETGIRFDWLLETLDSCATAHKVLFVDCTHADSNDDPDQLAVPTMIEIARSTRRGGFPRSLYVLGSCKSSRTAADIAPTTFAETLAEGFAGGADRSRNNHIKVTQLSEFVKGQMAGKPVLVIPNPAPPRISAAAKTGVLDLLAQFGNRRLNVNRLQADAVRITKVSGGQPEPNLAMGIVLLKAAKIDPAFEIMEAVRLKHPEYLVAHRCVTWVHFHKGRYDDGLRTLIEMLEQIPKPEDMERDYDAATLGIFEWAGKLRELAGESDWSRSAPNAVELETYDSLIDAFGDTANQSHQSGRNYVKKVMRNLAEQFKDKPDEAYKRERLQYYVPRIADGSVVSDVKAWLDK